MSECTYRVDDLPKRIAAKIAPDPATGCWVWTAYRNHKGYGRVRWGDEIRLAHRVVFHLLADSTLSVEAGIGHRLGVLDHVGCDNPGCVNPQHLRVATNRSNLSRRGGSSEFVGVRWVANRGKWRVAICRPGVRNRTYLGMHTSESFAAEVYDAAGYILFGEHPNYDCGRLLLAPSVSAREIASRFLQM